MAAITRFSCDRCGFVDHSHTLPIGWLNIGSIGLQVIIKSEMRETSTTKSIAHLCVGCYGELLKFLGGWRLA